MTPEEIRAARIPNGTRVVINNCEGCIESSFYEPLSGMGDVVYVVSFGCGLGGVREDYIRHKDITGTTLNLKLNAKQRKLVYALRNALTIK